MDESTLQRLANEVNYELDQMRAAAARLAALFEESKNLDHLSSQHQWDRGYEITVETNAFLESFLVHFRNLQDFLSPRKSVKPHDVTAAMFMGRPQEDRWHAPLQHRDPIDKRLAHISTARLDVPKDDKWRISAMVAELESSLRSYLSELREAFPNRAQWFR